MNQMHKLCLSSTKPFIHKAHLPRLRKLVQSTRGLLRPENDGVSSFDIWAVDGGEVR